MIAILYHHIPHFMLWSNQTKPKTKPNQKNNPIFDLKIVCDKPDQLQLLKHGQALSINANVFCCNCQIYQNCTIPKRIRSNSLSVIRLGDSVLLLSLPFSLTQKLYSYFLSVFFIMYPYLK